MGIENGRFHAELLHCRRWGDATHCEPCADATAVQHITGRCRTASAQVPLGTVRWFGWQVGVEGCGGHFRTAAPMLDPVERNRGRVTCGWWPLVFPVVVGAESSSVARSLSDEPDSLKRMEGC